MAVISAVRRHSKFGWSDLHSEIHVADWFLAFSWHCSLLSLYEGGQYPRYRQHLAHSTHSQLIFLRAIGNVFTVCLNAASFTGRFPSLPGSYVPFSQPSAHVWANVNESCNIVTKQGVPVSFVLQVLQAHSQWEEWVVVTRISIFLVQHVHSKFMYMKRSTCSKLKIFRGTWDPTCNIQSTEILPGKRAYVRHSPWPSLQFLVCGIQWTLKLCARLPCLCFIPNQWRQWAAICEVWKYPRPFI